MPDLRNNDVGAAVFAGVADGFGLQSCRDGSDGRLLEAGLEYPERRSLFTSSWHLEQQIRELNAAGCTDVEIAEALNLRGLSNTRGGAFNHGSIHLLRKRWDIPTVRINGVGNNPSRWPDGSYSVQGVADVLGTTTQTVFKWVRTGRLHGRQLTKGLPWQIDLSDADPCTPKGNAAHQLFEENSIMKAASAPHGAAKTADGSQPVDVDSAHAERRLCRRSPR
jgi:hypothetical protein